MSFKKQSADQEAKCLLKLREALIEGEKSGESVSFDFEAFIRHKKQIYLSKRDV